MIEINSSDRRYGILSALKLLKVAKERGLMALNGDGSNSKSDGRIMPDDVTIKQIDNDPENNSEVYDDSNLSDEEREARATKLANMEDETWADDDLEAIRKEMNTKADELAKAKAAAQARQASLDSISSFDMFQSDLLDAAISQISPKKHRLSSYSKLNKTAGGTGLIRKGEYTERDEPIPVFDVFVDRSSSMTGHPSRVQAVERVLKFLYELQDRDKLIINEYWFADSFGKKGASRYEIGGGNSCRVINDILHQIKTDNSQNVIIFTDSDMDYADSYARSSIVIPGVAFFVWLNGSSSMCLRDIIKTTIPENSRMYSLYS